jgi:hypothetical protein
MSAPHALATLAQVPLPVPNPISGIGDQIGQNVLDQFTRWIGDAAASVTNQIISFIGNATGVDLAGAFGGNAHTAAVFHKVLALSAVLMVGFVFLGVIHGLVKGDPGSIARVALVRVPMSIAGTVGLVAVTDLLLKVTDGASAFVISDAPADLAAFTETITTAAAATGNGAAGGLLGLVYLIGALLCLMTLVVRSALIYLLIAIAPVLLAARVWPAAAGAWRKLCEITLALIVSKFAIALALGIGAALLADGTTFGANSASGVDSAGQSIGKLAAGAAIMGVAAFCPFLLLKLMPLVETAVLAQGIGSAPIRGATQTTSMAFYGSSIKDRMTRATQGGGGSGGAGPAGASGAGGVPRAGGAPGAGGLPGVGSSAAGGGAGGAGGAAGGAAASGGAAAAAGPAAIVVAGAQVVTAAARTAKNAAVNTADGAASTGPSPRSSASASPAPSRPVHGSSRATTPAPSGDGSDE